MANKYKVWKVDYQYKIESNENDGPSGDMYVVIASSEAEAVQKADARFSYSDLNRNLLANGEAEGELGRGIVILSDLRRTASEFRELFSLPRLSLADTEQFSIRPRIGRDGESIEFIVAKK